MRMRVDLVARSARERGIVVFVALIAMVLLSLAAVALMRSVHTNTLVVGNLAFRQAAVSLSTAAVEKAVYDLFPPTRTIADTNHDLARNYYATHQAGEDANGIPAVLRGQNPPACQPPWQVMTDAEGRAAVTDLTSDFSLTLFDCHGLVPCTGEITGVTIPGTANYRHRVFEQVIPLRNQVWNPS